MVELLDFERFRLDILIKKLQIYNANHKIGLKIVWSYLLETQKRLNEFQII
jgi:hypothetical protein